MVILQLACEIHITLKSLIVLWFDPDIFWVDRKNCGKIYLKLLIQMINIYGNLSLNKCEKRIV